MANKPDVRVRAHTVYSVDLYDAPRTAQAADGLGLSQANDIAEALAAKHGGGHTRMSGSVTNYPVENVPTHLGPLYQELASLPPGASFTFSLSRKRADGPPALILERIIPEVVAAGDQPQAEKLGLHFDASKLQAMIHFELAKLKPALDDLAQESSITEIKLAMERGLKDVRDALPSETEIEAFVEQVREKTGRTKAALRRWAYVTLGDRLGEVALVDAKREQYAYLRAQDVAPIAAMNRAGFLTPTQIKANDLEADLHIRARIRHLSKLNATASTLTAEERLQALGEDSTEAEYRAAIRSALLSGLTPSKIIALAVRSADQLNPIVREGIADWINSEIDKLEH